MDEKEKALQSANITRQDFKQVKYTKNNSFKSQQQIVFEAFLTGCKTMKEVSVETGIDRSYICYYIAHLRDLDKIRFIRKRFCNITKHIAGEYTSNFELFSKSNQLKKL